MKQTKNIVLISALLLVLVIAVGAFYRTSFKYRKYEKVTPQNGEIIEAVYGLGKVKTKNRFEVRLGVISTVRNLYVQEGDQIKKGQKLIDFDTNAVFRSPIDGHVTLVAVYEGETVPAQTVVLRVENLKERFIELSLEQEGALRIRQGQKARVSFESLRGQTLTGTVRSIFPRDDEFLADIEVTKLDESVLPGMTADVSIEIGKISGTLVPLKALRNGILLVERDGKVQKMKVEVGLIDGLSAEIKSKDLKKTDEVLVPKD